MRGIWVRVNKLVQLEDFDTRARRHSAPLEFGVGLLGMYGMYKCRAIIDHAGEL